MLAVPECEDRGHLRLDDLIDVGRIETEPVGEPDQPQELGREKPHSALKPAAAQHIADQFFQRAGFVSWSGSSSRWRWTMKYRMWALSTLCCAFALQAT